MNEYKEKKDIAEVRPIAVIDMPYLQNDYHSQKMEPKTEQCDIKEEDSSCNDNDEDWMTDEEDATESSTLCSSCGKRKSITNTFLALKAKKLKLEIELLELQSYRAKRELGISSSCPAINPDGKKVVFIRCFGKNGPYIKKIVSNSIND